jgi:hypothetical protein
MNGMPHLPHASPSVAVKAMTSGSFSGANARARGGAEFLGDRHLEQYGQLLAHLG